MRTALLPTGSWAWDPPSSRVAPDSSKGSGRTARRRTLPRRGQCWWQELGGAQSCRKESYRMRCDSVSHCPQLRDKPGLFPRQSGADVELGVSSVWVRVVLGSHPSAVGVGTHPRLVEMRAGRCSSCLSVALSQQLLVAWPLLHLAAAPQCPPRAVLLGRAGHPVRQCDPWVCRARAC